MLILLSKLKKKSINMNSKHGPKLEPIPENGNSKSSGVLHSLKIVQAQAVLGVLVALVAVKQFTPGFFTTFISALVFSGVGILCSYVYYANRRAKIEAARKININPGIKGLKKLIGSLPTWISFQERDRVEWMNTMLLKMWPFYDYAICQSIKEVVEPIMEDHKPPVIIKKIGFKKIVLYYFTFFIIPLSQATQFNPIQPKMSLSYVFVLFAAALNLTLCLIDPPPVYIGQVDFEELLAGATSPDNPNQLEEVFAGSIGTVGPLPPGAQATFDSFVDFQNTDIAANIPEFGNLVDSLSQFGF
eukprot:TRINITY_DN17854_c0_g1_i2.p1 TRINITY_DN17854_c0_g1~~TRINITY_DN17854_c0_g1_i2.p1  ORF type:complete len:302 (-),score=42.56 TRINITY_DN17854_c0_g1_i2:852-1757(-)